MADVVLPDVVTTAAALPPPAQPVAASLTAPYARRKIDLTFRIGTGNYGESTPSELSFTGLRVNAHLQSVISPHGAQEVLLRVYGMTLSHMNQLSVAGLLYEGRQNNSVQVRAGDDVSGMTTVADATIVEAYPNLNGAADERHFYVYARGTSAAAALKPVAAVSYAGSVQVSQIMQTLAQQAGYTLQNDGVTAVLSRPYLWGTTQQQVDATARAANCFYFFDNVSKTLRIWPKNGTIPNQTAFVVSPSTGMIGYPEFQKATIVVRTMFAPQFAQDPGVVAIIQSDLTAANNARMTLVLVAHELSSETPGGPWETILLGAPPLGSAAQ